MELKDYKFNDKDEFKISAVKTDETSMCENEEEGLKRMEKNLKKISNLQQKLYAERKEGVIFVFQAMDAAGKDGVIRTVFASLTPHGVKEFCFKVPSSEELSHDYLWRFWSALPPKGNISIFNRSYYEDVLIGKVKKLYLGQVFPDRVNKENIIEDRYRQINEFEKYLYETGTRVVKIFLNVSKDEQARRFISRIDTPKKNWKVSKGDIEERKYWDDYQQAFEDMINNTSSKHCPWYVVPADNKWYERYVVSEIILNTLEEMDPHYPTLDEEEMEGMGEIRERLISEIGADKKEE